MINNKIELKFKITVYKRKSGKTSCIYVASIINLGVITEFANVCKREKKTLLNYFKIMVPE